MDNPLIIALDFPTAPAALSFLDSFGTERLVVKVGMELFYSAGPAIVHEIQKRGHQVFLDLKLHDIPNTVQSAMEVIGTMGVAYTTIHAAGGVAMLKAGRQGLLAGAKAVNCPAPKLLAITQLTSTNQQMLNDQLGISGTVENSVLHLATNALSAETDGVICAAQEAAAIHQATNQHFLCLTPGIRPVGSQNGDQKRVMTPSQAARQGSNGIVVGRPITRASDVVTAYRQIKSEWERAINE